MQVSVESPDQPEIIRLIAELDAYQDTLYPPESRHALDLHALCQPNVVFAVARNREGEAIGCGSVVLSKEYGELKRMYVHPNSRGSGVATAVLSLLESHATQRGCVWFVLETGPSQPEALAFYARSATQSVGGLVAIEKIHSVFSWRSTLRPNPSIERARPGKPGRASHVKR